MNVKRQNCESCMHYDVCSVKTDIDLFKNDLYQMLKEKGQTYASIIKPFDIEVTCKHFIQSASVKKQNSEK